MRPYYEDNSVTIYHGKYLELLPAVDLSAVELLCADPPYGINYRSNHNSYRRPGVWAGWVRTENLPGIKEDDVTLDPTPFLQFPKVAIFGGNYFADQLPPSRCWVTWDKRDGIGPNNQADCEMIWTNFPKVSRIYRHLWSGLLRAGEENVSKATKLHPHQKPVALLRWLIQYADTTGTILDTHMGSGTTLRAAKDLGLKAIGFEREEQYCEIAAMRMAQEVLAL